MIQMTSKPYTQESSDTAGVVYIVEDDEAVRDSLKWLLEASSYRVELFESGEMFLAKFDPNAIAVLVLDVRMPGMSGLEVQEHLIARKCDIPIIFISGHGERFDGSLHLEERMRVELHRKTLRPGSSALFNRKNAAGSPSAQGQG